MKTVHRNSLLPRTEVHDAVSDLLHVDPWRGLRITLANVVGMNALVLAAFVSEPFYLFLGFAVLAGFFYTAVLMTTHDAIHHTLTGWYYFDEIVPRVFSYFVFWPHGLYAELHKIHHRLNGKDPSDPESPTYQVSAYQRAGGMRRLLIRHDWWLSLFVYGGVGMIVRHLWAAMKLYRSNASIRRAFVMDGIGIFCAGGVVLLVAIHTGALDRYLIYLLCLERIIGFFHQMRSRIEHYGLHGERGDLLATRLYNCRNVRTHPLVSRFFNGLNFHSVHHAFPSIPFYLLQKAHDRIGALCAAKGKPLEEEHGYVRTLWKLARQPLVLVDDVTGEIRPSH